MEITKKDISNAMELPVTAIGAGEWVILGGVNKEAFQVRSVRDGVQTTRLTFNIEGQNVSDSRATFSNDITLKVLGGGENGNH